MTDIVADFVCGLYPGYLGLSAGVKVVSCSFSFFVYSSLDLLSRAIQCTLPMHFRKQVQYLSYVHRSTVVCKKLLTFRLNKISNNTCSKHVYTHSSYMVPECIDTLKYI